jgi:phage terminase Nu1 subunit (DNA packaging protein)
LNIQQLSDKELAQCFGVDIRTVANWKKTGIPRNGTKYELTDVIRWRIAHEVAKAKKSSKPDDQIDGDKWLAEFRKQRAKIALLERLQKRGSLVPVAEAQKVLVEEVTAAKTALVAMPRKLAPRLYGKEPRDIEREIREEIDAVLNRLSSRKVKIENETRTSATEADDSERMEATGEDDGIRMGREKPRAAGANKRGGRPVAKRTNPVSRRRDGPAKRSAR